MELRQLRHLAALADFQNFQRAADAIGLSQSALSRSIQTLERDLDCELVDRQSRDFRLTGQGQLVLQHARRLLSGTRSLRNELEQYNGLNAGELRFGCGPYPAQLLVPEAMADFIRAHPAIDVGFLMGDWEQMAQLLKEEQVEFFIGDARNFAGDPDYQVRWMDLRPGRFFCRPGHPLTGQGTLRLAALLDDPRVGTRIRPRRGGGPARSGAARRGGDPADRRRAPGPPRAAPALRHRQPRGLRLVAGGAGDDRGDLRGRSALAARKSCGLMGRSGAGLC
ncbi:LysR family transcriptional regulator [Pseudomonas nitroreducens]|uniref:LysR family transcriptional regulator n=1 Tax=Pseudomonas nitroreducens TaxID=46680 RepID=UPI0028B04C02|nr:LysR family transcriptional regulator [Pseudomonas nitroreducens]